jgi:hypothetical protein
MLSVKKAQDPPSSSPRTYRKELEYLHARRMAVDALIRSLEEYGRFRAKKDLPVFRRKSA